MLEKTKPQRGRDSAGGRHAARGAGARESLHDVPLAEPLMIMPQRAFREARTCFFGAERRDNEGPNKPWDCYKENLSHVRVVLITTLQHTIHNSTTIHYYPLPLPLPLAIHLPTYSTNQPTNPKCPSWPAALPAPQPPALRRPAPPAQPAQPRTPASRPVSSAAERRTAPTRAAPRTRRRRPPPRPRRPVTTALTAPPPLPLCTTTSASLPWVTRSRALCSSSKAR
jgi:hypothetical protein